MSRDRVFIPAAPVWAWHPDRREHEEGYTLFRRVVICAREEDFRIAVSADCRFNFYLDGRLLGRGPVRSNLEHYYFDEYSGKLFPGTHVFAAEVVVWRDGWRNSTAPWSEMHAGGGFLAAGYAGTERLELPHGWLTCRDEGRRPLAWREAWENGTLCPAPPMDEIDFNCHDCRWATAFAPQGEWVAPTVLGKAVFRAACETDPATPWLLEPRPISQLSAEFTPLAKLLVGEEDFRIEAGRLRGCCPAGNHTVLIDLGRNQSSLIHFVGHGGKGRCRLAYAESLFDAERCRTRTLPGAIGQLGYADSLILPGGEEAWRYDSFWYRAGRFLELEFTLETSCCELELEVEFITYPFGEWKEFHAPGDPVLEKIYATAIHTLRCCAHEHFEDCPYYEQMQYAGDTRIEALVSYAATGNDILGRQALRAFAQSQLAGGFTQSRYPSTFRQVIPGYCLIWALMAHDHWCFFGDLEPVRELMPNLEFMLEAFERRRLNNRLIGPVAGWHFTDWVNEWPGGASDRGENFPETIINLFYAEACRCVGVMKAQLGLDGTELLRRAEVTLEAVRKHGFDPERNRFRDVPGRDWYSVHANVLAVLFGAVPEAQGSQFLREVLADGTLAQPTLYFEFYILGALQRYGTPEEFRRRLGLWEKMLKMGYTTFPERPSLTARSECHAWSTAPAWFLLDGDRMEANAQ